MAVSKPDQFVFVADASATTKLNLTMAVSDCDHVRDVVNGVVRVDGITLTPMVLPVEEIFFRTTKYQEWDVAEMSTAKYVSFAAAGDAPFIAIPVFPSRAFRHSAIYVRNDRGIGSPKDLEGKRVGIPEWAQTAGVYVRGMLQDQYGVDLSKVLWVQAGVNEIGRKEKVAINLRGQFHYSEGRTSLNEMLLSGEIDAAITARPPNAFQDRNPLIVRLFPDFRQRELQYYRETKIFPIMHVVVLRQSLYESNRWIATNLLKAFDEAKIRSIRRLIDITAAGMPFAWAAALTQEVFAEFDSDPWPYGIDGNSQTLTAFCRYVFDQGIAKRLMPIQELFPVEVRERVRV